MSNGVRMDRNQFTSTTRIEAHEPTMGVALTPKPMTLAPTWVPFPTRVVKCQAPVLARYLAGSSNQEALIATAYSIGFSFAHRGHA